MAKARRDRVGISLACVGIVLLGAAACSRIGGSGKVVTKSISVSSFSKLQVGSAFEVTVFFGDQEALTLHVDDNLTGHVDAGVSGGTPPHRAQAGDVRSRRHAQGGRHSP